MLKWVYMKVGILGAGDFGKAMGVVVRKNGNATYFFDPAVFPERTIKDVIAFSDALLVAVPSSAMRKLLSSFPEAGFMKPLIVTTKGLFDPEIFEKFREVEIVSGPGFASEIVEGKRVKLTIAKRGVFEGATLSEKLLGTETLKFDKTDDVKGVMILSGLKNIYAIESGRRKLTVKSDEFKEFIKTALIEAQKILLYNGGFLESVRLQAGVGDFVLTCGSEMSRNYQFGKRLGEFEMAQRGRRGRFYPAVFKANRDARLRQMLFPRGTTIEGVNAARAILRGELFVPREAEILSDILRRIKHDVEL